MEEEMKTMELDLRETGVSSGPVSTPTAMPKIRFQGSLKKLVTAFSLLLAVLTTYPAEAQNFHKGLIFYERAEYTAALREWRPLAEQGDADAQFHLVSMYGKGQGVARDYAKAAGWLHKAALNNVADAQFLLGLLYADGRGVAQDYAEAVKWFRKATAQNNADAQFFLGLMYAYGKGGVPQDYAQAAEWYRKAADQGDAQAQFSLGMMYGDGRGVPKNYAKALMWLHLAADHGSARATYNQEKISKLMTTEQTAEAQHMVHE
jgi:TPR repeat protein